MYGVKLRVGDSSSISGNLLPLFPPLSPPSPPFPSNNLCSCTVQQIDQCQRRYYSRLTFRHFGTSILFFFLPFSSLIYIHFKLAVDFTITNVQGHPIPISTHEESPKTVGGQKEKR
jgi:hypothetical protein